MKTRVIIPAAGFGTRMQPLRSDQAKELLLHPTLKKPMIEVAIENALRFNFEPIVVTRNSKTELIVWMKNHYPNILVQQIESSTEWADTVLQSQFHWADKNILLLPDTDFEPVEALREIDLKLNLNELVFAVFENKDFSKWGVVQEQNQISYICEKPSSCNDTAKVWGMIGFQKKSGMFLFQSILKSHLEKKWQPLLSLNAMVKLTHFNDFTR